MKNLPENSPGKGTYAVQTWAEINKSGGPAPRIDEIKEILEGGEEGLMLSRDEVKQRITDYFQSKICIIENEETKEPVTVWKSAPTKSELAAKLGISMATLARYNRGEYGGGRQYQGGAREICEPESFPIIQRAMLVISDFYERQLSLNKNNSGVIFWLLNSQNERWTNEQRHVLEEGNVSGRVPAIDKENLLKISDITEIDGPDADF